MKQEFIAREMRHHLDENLKKPIRSIDAPKNGCIRATRLALNMSTAQLGARMRLTRNCIIKNEGSEMRGEITLSSMRRAAEAMKCKLVYFFVPEEGSLEKTYENRKLFMARGQIEARMAPEKIDRNTLNEMAKKYARGITPEEVWNAIANMDELAPLEEDSAEAKEKARKTDERDAMRQERDRQRAYNEILQDAKKKLRDIRDNNTAHKSEENADKEKMKFLDDLGMAMTNAKMITEHYLKAVEEGRCDPLPDDVVKQSFANWSLRNDEPMERQNEAEAPDCVSEEKKEKYVWRTDCFGNAFREPAGSCDASNVWGDRIMDESEF